ncbi:unnamed protein product [Polarella glacialis]|uniref:Uncharacterized protein n=1 Tax=Polarella glacialis TaxID=89957 RepID=A0A813HZ41_POLGL|nr:unnamed protein product [Polarella glacialis]
MYGLPQLPCMAYPSYLVPQIARGRRIEGGIALPPLRQLREQIDALPRPPIQEYIPVSAQSASIESSCMGGGYSGTLASAAYNSNNNSNNNSNSKNNNNSNHHFTSCSSIHYSSNQLLSSSSTASAPVACKAWAPPKVSLMGELAKRGKEGPAIMTTMFSQEAQSMVMAAEATLSARRAYAAEAARKHGPAEDQASHAVHLQSSPRRTIVTAANGVKGVRGSDPMAGSLFSRDTVLPDEAKRRGIYEAQVRRTVAQQPKTAR